MFEKDEIFLLKELIELEIEEVNKMIQESSNNDKEELKAHKTKLFSISEKLNNL